MDGWIEDCVVGEGSDWAASWKHAVAPAYDCTMESFFLCCRDFFDRYLRAKGEWVPAW
jgi:hypothetical protein